jgi:hypothetical protein
MESFKEDDPGKPMLDAVTGPVASEPPVSCVIGAWLVKVRYPVRVVAAELLAMAEHGLLIIEAGAEGYTLRVVAEAGTLSRDRQTILEGLLLGQPEGLLTRPPEDKADAGTAARGGRLTTDQLRAAIGRTAESTRMVSRISWLMAAIGAAGLGATVYSLVRGYAWGVETGIGTGLLGSWWIKRPVLRSRRARAVTHRLEQLRLVLRAEADLAGDRGPAPPAWHFPWAMVLLPDPLMDWWIQRNVRATPPWWMWADGTAAAFLSYDGVYGFFAAVRYSMIVN